MDDELLRVAKALSVRSRADIHGLVERAEHGLRPVEIARQVGYTEATVCGHLRVLLEAGLVKKVRRGCRWTYAPSNMRYTIVAQTITPS